MNITPLLLLAPLLAHAPPAAPGLTAPHGFVVTEFADSALANDIYTMTVDAKGRPVVAGRGYVRVLVDDDNDGRADRAIPFAAGPKDGAMGLLWEGDTLYAVGDGGLRRYRDADGDGRADGPSELIRALKTGGEHAAHAVCRGPDGWLYVLCGNNTDIDAKYATLPTSPIKEPTAGCVARFSPDFKHSEIVAHGFRNPYGMDFNPAGDLFTFDSDNERCVSLPWYEPTRLYHVVAGRHYGWLSPQSASFWRRPPYFVDVMPPVATLGRGSPTGVACYRHTAFPPEYRGGLFLCDWTFGKVHFAPLERRGASYKAEPRVFLEATGDNGFAPTAAAVQPTTGDLFVSIGGRGTRGAVYRIHHAGAAAGQVIPLAARDLDATADLKPTGTPAERLWALQMMRRHPGRVPAADRAAAVRANETADDPAHRQAAADLLRDLLAAATPAERRAWQDGVTDARRVVRGLAFLPTDPAFTRQQGLALLGRLQTPGDRLAGLRLVQLALGDVGDKKLRGTLWEGYSVRTPPPAESVVEQLEDRFPSSGRDLDRELSRTLAMLGPTDAALRDRLLDYGRGQADPAEVLHYLAVFARLPGERSEWERARVAAALLALDQQLAKQKLNRDLNWPLRVQELCAALFARDKELPAAMLAAADFGRPDHAVFAGAAGFPREAAAARFFARFRDDPAYPLTPAVAALLHHVPAEELLPVLRARWGETGQESALLPLLARQPRPADRPKFVDGLTAPQPATVRACARALDQLADKADPAELFALVQALRHCPDNQKELRAALAGRLGRVTGQAHGPDAAAWAGWLGQAHPDLAARLGNPDGVDVAGWTKRLARVDWAAGRADRGKAVFAKASCVNCHAGGQALGPDLTGVATRFARPDLLTAIVQPSRDVPARYRATAVETADGKVYQGLIVYDAADSLILQTGAAATVRLPGGSVVGRRPQPRSLMPAGLLDPLTDAEIADLVAYLRGPGR